MQKSFTLIFLMPWILTLSLVCQLGCRPKAKPVLPNGSVGFFEVYNIEEIGPDLIKANNTLATILDNVNTHSTEKNMGVIERKKDSLTVVEKTIANRFPLTKFWFMMVMFAMPKTRSQMMPQRESQFIIQRLVA